MPHSVYVSSVDGHQSCIQFLATVNSTSMNRCAQISFWDPVFNNFGYIPRSGLAGTYGSPNFIFKGMFIVFFIAVASLYNCTKRKQFQMLHQGQSFS